VQPPTAAEAGTLKEGATLIGFLQPYSNQAGIQALAARRVTAFAMELMPRITRAQPMDALSAMSTVAGYKAVLMAANRLPKFFPLLMTAAGTLTPARVFILGAGVAGLQAIGTAKRLGAVVEAYDTRPVVKEQVESLGGKFVELGQEVVKHGVVTIGPVNLPSTLPFHASQMYSRTVTSYLLHLVKEGRVQLDLNDELTRAPLVTHQGEILHQAK